MAKSFVCSLGGVEFALAPEKVDRARLYGWVDVEAQDEQGRRCDIATLLSDGKTIAGKGGVALASMSPDGEWLDRRQLRAVDPEGKPLAPVPSTFAAPVPLAATATIEEYLSHDVKAVYALRPEGDCAALRAELAKGTIYTFPYSFRGGVEADAGFLLVNPEGELFLAVGAPTRLRFVGLDQAAALSEEDDAAEGEDEETLDFGMM